uniref:Uncharacterized protein n=1 Tax=Anguilla anguilla TaxID=7936 RepID=A0A0E9TFU4_ANGAN
MCIVDSQNDRMILTTTATPTLNPLVNKHRQGPAKFARLHYFRKHKCNHIFSSSSRDGSQLLHVFIPPLQMNDGDGFSTDGH